MTYLDALVQVFKWIGYFIWFLVSTLGTWFFILDLTDEAPPYKYSKECLILCIVSLIFMLAYIVYKMSNR
jgi:membrane protein DedA with SNARE-associated domain